MPGVLYLGLVTSRRLEGAPDTDFEREAHHHHTADRAPFSFDLRRQMLEAALRECLPAVSRRRVRIIPLPRPELDFAIIESIFPAPRVWIIPRAGEAFDELKAQFFAGRGDGVIRVPIEPRVSGREVRALVAAEAWTELEHHTPRGVIRRLREACARKKAT